MLATDLLKESVDKLNITTQNSDFRKNASNVIAAMLEARMCNNNKKKSPAFDDDIDFLPPPPPLPYTKPPNFNGQLQNQDLPLPAPPCISPCKIPSSILTPPLSSDENDFPQKPIKCNGNNGNSNSIINGHNGKINGDEKVNYRHKKHHHNNNNHQSTDIPSTFGINKAELSTHARDRRSYIEKNNNNNINNNNNNNSNEIGFNPGMMDKDTLDTIANGIANGQHPVCDKCKCKITRCVDPKLAFMKFFCVQ
jgi:hypothetical protein